MEQQVIDVNHISKVYKLYNKASDRFVEALGLNRKELSKKHYALDDVSFTVNKGESIGIIGTNGSGKSTILKIITGVLSPTSGSVSVDGRISALLELGAGFNMEYTGIENIYLNGTMLGFTKEEIDEKLPEILKFADIGEFVNQPVKTYSSGMFVRLAFSVAINVDPEILIVDEALSVGDVFFQAKCYHKFEEFKKMGKTLIFVSHDLSSINKYCDRVVLLNKGHMLAQGKPKDMIDMYKKLLVNQLDQSEENQIETSKDPTDDNLWKSKMNCNSNVQDYGEKQGEIYDFAIVDEFGNITNLIEKGHECTFKLRVRANQDVHDPIFAVTIKDKKGVDITGTNTMYEGHNIPVFKQGERLEVSFTQAIDLQGGDYVISLGFTGYKEGEFCVYHRLYDVCNLTVISDKDTVGYYDTNSVVSIKREGDA